MGGAIVDYQNRRALIAASAVWAAVATLWLLGGCGGNLAPLPPPLFTVPLVVAGEPVDAAIVDTGGGYEVLLRQRFGLDVVGSAQVLAFGGREIVDVTEGFSYTAGGVSSLAPFAIVGLSTCDCNGVGYHFFRKTGIVLDVDFAARAAHFVRAAPLGGLMIPFSPPPAHLAGFDSAFLDVQLFARAGNEAAGEGRAVSGLLDTGANRTTMHRRLLGAPDDAGSADQDIIIAHDRLGAVAATVGLFDTDGLPDLIIGTDVMAVWADRWYFAFAADSDGGGGRLTIFTDSQEVNPMRGVAGRFP